MIVGHKTGKRPHRGFTMSTLGIDKRHKDLRACGGSSGGINSETQERISLSVFAREKGENSGYILALRLSCVARWENLVPQCE